MELAEALEKSIMIHWWNFGKKTLDFEGTYNDFFKNKNIKISKISKKGVKGLKFVIPVGCAIIDLKVFSSGWPIQDLNSAIKLFLTYLGDKTLFTGYNKTFKLNWN